MKVASTDHRIAFKRVKKAQHIFPEIAQVPEDERTDTKLPDSGSNRKPGLANCERESDKPKGGQISWKDRYTPNTCAYLRKSYYFFYFTRQQ
jgi:hypothetical protein